MMNRQLTPEKLQEASQAVRDRTSLVPQIAMVLGSGLGYLAELTTDSVTIPYASLPHFPQPTTPGHAGSLVLGTLEGKAVAILSGRIHYYEGYELHEVVFPLRVLSLLGASQLLVTNAAGGINPAFAPGDLMLLRDHLNLLGQNPLRGTNLDDLGPRFPDMTTAYSPRLRQIALQAAQQLHFTLHEGVYAATPGPSYETPAEIAMFRTLGADAVGMSTVPEVIAARHMQMEILGISCISNLAAGIHPGELSHDDVTLAVNQSRDRFSQLLRLILQLLPLSPL